MRRWQLDFFAQTLGQLYRAKTPIDRVARIVTCVNTCIAIRTSQSDNESISCQRTRCDVQMIRENITR